MTRLPAPPVTGTAAACAVLVNDAGQYALWPGEQPVPPGWERCFAGSEREAAAYVDARWSDLFPEPDAHPGREGSASHDLVGRLAAVAARHPEATAVVAPDGRHRYRELLAQTEHLARELRRRGVGPGSLVAVAVPRSRGLLVALLGVLAAGGAYVPLDPGHGRERLRGILGDAAPVAVVTSTATPELPLPPGTPVVTLGHDGAVAGEPATGTPECEPAGTGPREQPVSGGWPAYVIYTSGSTGRPKGVVVSRAALASLLDAMAEALALSPTDRMLALTTVAFDIAAAELFLPLLAGATVHLAEEEASGDPDRLAALVRRVRPTVMQATPSLWRLLMLAHPASVAGVRLLTVGEPLRRPLSDTMLDHAAGVTNLYGPTEATIYATLRELTPGVAPDIGTPLPHLRAYVLDEHLRPVPEGGRGELFLAGAGLATGYHRRPALTARCFTADPFGPPGTRMYRTGDVVQRLPGGALQYLGRTDDMVKIRGHRVELGEVEHALHQHPAVADAVACAVPPPGGDGELELHALLVPRRRPADGAARPVDDRELRGFLEARLPRAFVPTQLVWTDRLPLGPTGKTDRSAAARLLRERGAARGGDAATDDVLAALWREALGPAADADTGFRTAGGHSLAAARLIGAVAETWGVRLPFRLLLKDDVTLARLRELLPDRPNPPADAPTGAACGDGTDDGTDDGGDPATDVSLPLPPSLHRLWVVRRLYPAAATAYQVVSAVEVTGTLDPERLDRALAVLVRRFDALRATVEEEVEGDAAGAPRLRIAGTVPRRRTEVVTDEDYDPAAFVARSVALPVPADAPLLRLRLLVGEGRCCLALVVDHLVADLRAAHHLLSALLAEYQAPAEASPPEVSYRRHAERELARVGDPRWRQDLARQRELLADAPTALDLALSGARPPEPTFRAHVRTRPLPAALAARLPDVAARLDTTTTGFLLGCFAALLRSWSGLREVTVGLPADARRSPAEQRLVGMVTDTLVVRSGLGATVGDVVRSCRDAHLEAVEHASAPFDAVVAELRPATEPGRNPLFQAWFNDLTAVCPPVPPAGMPVRPLPTPVHAALFDVAVYLQRVAGTVEVSLVGAADLFPREVVDELGDQYLRLVEQAAADPETPLAALRLGEPPAPPPASTTRHPVDLWHRLETWEHVDPEAPAVRAPTGDVSYRELAASVAHLSRLLTAAGAAPGTTVALCSTADARLPALLPAVWRTGATLALLPADAPPRYRAACRAAVGPVLTVDLTDGADPEAVTLRELESRAGHAARDRTPPRWPAPDTTTHVLFTSGTTGRPRAVRARLDGLADTLGWYLETFDVTGEDRFALLSGPAHDPVLRDVLAPLAAGASVCVPPPGLPRDPARLARWLLDSRVTVLHATPGLLDLLCAGAEAPLPDLRLVVSAGDALTAGQVRRLRQVTDAAVVNAYGTTETPQVAACAVVLERGRPHDTALADHQVLPVGRGVAGREVHVVNARGERLGPGQAGEVVVRGPNLSQGYLDDDSAGGRLGPDPEGAPDQRLYRTGDRGHLTTDGQVVVSGRLDRQVSRGGYRVELGHVEAVARQFPAVRAARAEQLADAAGPLLVLAVAAGEGHAVDVAALRTHLRGRLPRYAVPDVVTVEPAHLVLDASHKLRVDPAARAARPRADRLRRGALPRPGDGTSHTGGAAADGRRRRTVQLLTDLVAEQLGRRVPPRQNFFDAGFSSLGLLRLHHAVARHVAPGVPVTALFSHPSVAALADFLQTLDHKERT